MELLIIFFRDILDGFLYFVYVFVCIFAIFYVFGISADRKRKAIEDKLKEKKKYDIMSGREAAIAALESKQVLDVEDDPPTSGAGNENENATLNAALNSMPNTSDAAFAASAKKEEVPSVMVLNSSGSESSNQTDPQSQNGEQAEKKPLVIDTSSLRT